jgi:hypothetical protein
MQILPSDASVGSMRGSKSERIVLVSRPVVLSN